MSRHAQSELLTQLLQLLLRHSQQNHAGVGEGDGDRDNFRTTSVPERSKLNSVQPRLVRPVSNDASAVAGDACDTAEAFPTDAKERERAVRKKQKESGAQHVVKKKKKDVEEHYDDCGEDLSSLQELTMFNIGKDTDAEDDNMIFGYPIEEEYDHAFDDITVPRIPAQVLMRDPRIPRDPSLRRCPGCMLGAGRDDPRHSRVDGRCAYPHDLPKTWDCRGCRNKAGRDRPAHTLIPGKCKWAGPEPPARVRPHDPVPPTHMEPTMSRRPQDPDGRPLGTLDEEQLHAEDMSVAILAQAI